MNAYPLLYGRTKFVDYLSDFLVKPNGVDYHKCGKYISGMTKDLDSNKVRYCVFDDGEYLICGISCFVDELYKRTGKADLTSYAKDKFGRGIMLFIGYAFPKTGFATGNDIPDIGFDDLADIFLKYIPEQWNYPSGVSGRVTSDQYNVVTKIFDSVNLSSDLLNGINLVSGIDEKKAFEIFLRKNLSGDNSSFISNVSTKQQFEKLAFEYAIVEENVINSVKLANDAAQPPAAISPAKPVSKINPLVPIAISAAVAVGGILSVVLFRFLNQ